MSTLTKILNDLQGIKLESIVFIVGLIAISLLLSKVMSKKGEFNTRKLTYGSICIAISFILSYFKYGMPQGGSLTLGSLIPLLFFAYTFGVRDGIIAGMVYGMLQFIQEPYIFHWFQVLLDYPFAFGALGLAGYAKKDFRFGITLGCVGRFVFHFLSGILFFASYAIELGKNPILYSAEYNAFYVGFELLSCILVASIPQVKNALNRIKSESAR